MVRGEAPPASVPESWSRGEEVTPPARYRALVVSGKEGMPPRAIGPDVMARGGRGNLSPCSLKKIDNWL